MHKSNEPVNTGLRLLFIVLVSLSILLFIGIHLFVSGYESPVSNVTLERYAIAVTLIGIPLSLKLFHEKVKKLDREDATKFRRQYRTQYFIRLGIIGFVYLFNLISLYATGAKNFSFIIIITIFAFFLCVPQKAHFNNEENNK